METRLKLEGFHLVHFSELAQVAFSCCDRCHTSGLKICVGQAGTGQELSGKFSVSRKSTVSSNWPVRILTRETLSQGDRKPIQFYLAKIPSHPRSFPSRIQMLMKNVWHKSTLAHAGELVSWPLSPPQWVGWGQISCHNAEITPSSKM